jgi:hypothetical protein
MNLLLLMYKKSAAMVDLNGDGKLELIVDGAVLSIIAATERWRDWLMSRPYVVIFIRQICWAKYAVSF